MPMARSTRPLHRGPCCAGSRTGRSRRWEGTDQKAAAYAMSWGNPRPEVAIASVDLVGAAEHRGVPALLALTAARRK
jgi:hypothetical protein